MTQITFTKAQLVMMRSLIETTAVEAFVLDVAGIVITRAMLREYQHKIGSAKSIAIPVLGWGQ